MGISRRVLRQVPCDHSSIMGAVCSGGNNSKFMRGKGKAREAIEREVLSRFAVEKPDPKGSEYLLSIPYSHEDELDRIIYEEIFAEMGSQVDERHCFIEADLTAVDNPERRW